MTQVQNRIAFSVNYTGDGDANNPSHITVSYYIDFENFVNVVFWASPSVITDSIVSIFIEGAQVLPVPQIGFLFEVGTSFIEIVMCGNEMRISNNGIQFYSLENDFFGTLPTPSITTQFRLTAENIATSFFECNSSSSISSNNSFPSVITPNRSWLVPVIVILFALLLGGAGVGGYFLWRFIQKKRGEIEYVEVEE